MGFELSPMKSRDWSAARAIYREGIATRNATFETVAPAWKKWDRDHLRCCRLVARSPDSVVGWAALSPVSSRRVYAGVAEASIYVAKHVRRQGVWELMSALIDASEREGIWILQAGIFPENIPSLKLWKRAGFRVVGIRERLGAMYGRWRDVLLLERRSARVGSNRKYKKHKG